MILYVDVGAIDEDLARVQRAGASVVQGKTAVPGVGWSAIVRDPEGNCIGLFQKDESAVE